MIICLGTLQCATFWSLAGVMGRALPWAVILPYAGTVPDGGRQG